MPVISAPDIVVGIAATRGAADRGDRLGGVDHPAAAEGDEALGALGRVEDRRGGVGDAARRDQVDRAGRLRQARRAGERPLGR